MTSSQTYSIEGKDAEVVRLIVKLDLTAVSTVNVIVSGATTFNRAFATGHPFVVGTNVPLSSVAHSAIATTTAVSIYFRGFSDSAHADGVVTAVATLEGRLA